MQVDEWPESQRGPEMNAYVDPPLVLAETEVRRLSVLAQCQATGSSAGLLLKREINRALIRKDAFVPFQIVRMYSTIRFTVDGVSSPDLLIVYPSEEDRDAGMISALSWEGSAVIGLALGSTIRWPGNNGLKHEFTVTRVSQPTRLLF